MARKRPAAEAEVSLFSNRAAQPLAGRMRPRMLDEFIGQEHLLACHNPVEAAEIAAARPLRPGFQAAPPPPGATGDPVAPPG